MTCRCPGCLKGETCWRPDPQPPTGRYWVCAWCDHLNSRRHHVHCRRCGRDIEQPKEDT